MAIDNATLTSRLSVLFNPSTRKKIQTESKQDKITAGEVVRRAVLAYFAGKGSK